MKVTPHDDGGRVRALPRGEKKGPASGNQPGPNNPVVRGVTLRGRGPFPQSSQARPPVDCGSLPNTNDTKSIAGDIVAIQRGRMVAKVDRVKSP
jgi:hypothetical protein